MSDLGEVLFGQEFEFVELDVPALDRVIAVHVPKNVN
jgi:hypothetical protein